MNNDPIDTGDAFDKKAEDIVTVIGTYHAISAPTKGLLSEQAPKDHAVVELPDGTKIYLDAVGNKNSVRGRDELGQFDNTMVTVTGKAWRIMPSPGAGLIAPCLTDITNIAIAEE